LGEVLDELAAEDDLDDILDSALNDHESKVPDEGTMVGREDQSENQDDASVNSNADTVISRKADGPAGSGRLVGAPEDPAIDAEALSAQNELLQQLMNAAKGNEGM